MCFGGRRGGTSLLLVHVVLLSISVGIGIGSVVGKIGLKNTDPFVFAFYRQICAAPLVSLWSYKTERSRIDVAVIRKDWAALSLAGVLMFVSNGCYTTATKVADPVIGAAWQTTAPVFTIAIAMALGWESPTPLKVGGIALALGGALFIVFVGVHIAPGSSAFVGNVLYFCNVNAYASYALVMRPLLKRHPPLLITAISFWAVSAWLLLSCAVIQLLLPAGARGWISGSEHPWALSALEVGALAYFVAVYSVLMYSAINWANQHVAASTVMTYAVVQPVAAGLMSWMLIAVGFNAEHDVGLQMPGINAAGTLGVGLGLFLIVKGEMVDEKAGKSGGVVDPGAAVHGGTGKAEEERRPLLHGNRDPPSGVEYQTDAVAGVAGSIND